MSGSPPSVVMLQEVEQKKGRLVARIQERLFQAELRLKQLETEVARCAEQFSRSEAELCAVEAAHQRQLEEVRAALAVLEALEKEFNSLLKDIPGKP
jgi:hypothetical protein